MGHDKFDFNVASSLIQVVEGAASAIDVKNGQMEKKFGALHEFFKDAGYDEFESEMNAANKVIEDIISQLHEVSKHIGDYSQRLQNEV